MKRFIFLSLSVISLLVLITGCSSSQTPPVAATTPVIGTFSNSPSAINSGGTTTLVWSVTGANSVSIDQGIGQVDLAGSRSISPASSTVYTISATNSGGTVTRSATATVNSAAPAPAAPVPFAVTSVIASTSPTNFTGACPKTFIFNAAITANGPGIVTYRWEESSDGDIVEFSDIQSVTFDAAGTITTTLKWDLLESAAGLHMVHVLTPNDIASIPVYYELKCGSGSLVTGLIVGVDQYPFTGTCPKTINFWATIATNGPGTLTYRWERDDGTTIPGTITFSAAGTQTISNQWTRGAGDGWQLLHMLTPDDGVSTQIDFTMTCDQVK